MASISSALGITKGKYLIKCLPVRSRFVNVEEYHLKLGVLSMEDGVYSEHHSTNLMNGTFEKTFTNFSDLVISDYEILLATTMTANTLLQYNYDLIPLHELKAPIFYALSDYADLNANKQGLQNNISVAEKTDTFPQTGAGQMIALVILVEAK